MSAVRRARAFTLIEAMIVVVMVGILAILASVGYRRWVRNSYMGEAQNMLANIRTGEEAFRAENGGYLKVSIDLSPASLYPSTTPKGSFVTEWGAGANATSWMAINVHPDSPVRFGYAVIADNTNATAPPAINANGQAANIASMQGQPWYVAQAICDLDSDGAAPDTTVYAVSGTNQLFVNDEGL